MISNVSFGQKYAVSTANNSSDLYNRFNNYCKIRSHLQGKTIFQEKLTADGMVCTLDIHDSFARKVEDYCKTNGINFKKVD